MSFTILSKKSVIEMMYQSETVEKKNSGKSNYLENKITQEAKIDT